MDSRDTPIILTTFCLAVVLKNLDDQDIADQGMNVFLQKPLESIRNVQM